ncbi:topoisomerase [Pseudomonas sp. Choline-3u-10]|jgi:putative DNA primase/helicase|uniref:toprim domain-containing protein n=1 Tax=Pseudomonadaceae TaxID=135621 RepID=UPI0006180E43|nr:MULTISPECIES: toprim domain-containing protein [Pseudomonadaceae]MBU0949141.1 toprim domain-containing protein [Gammaproteobacteria bacterium]HBM09972.1 topoisomerase [Pseudomonas sp.]MBK3794014.1 topoisomerase [Stutzerimonas stutzeri]MBK3875504.1 topoisomerase [Stutzerimonas stutzeri]PKG94582.1 topoisomerase [Pseudomonas sp. Choline-3u-10]|tara:strand:+ start:4030 stop:4959 length:930 start_codon:yes stop_codon:yes gene_type:complete
MTIQNGVHSPRGSACLEKAELAFRDALQATFGPLDWLPVADGTIHRFRVPDDKPGTLNGWYVLHLDGIASGAFGSWKAGGSSTWTSRKPADPMEAELIRQRVEQAREQREADQTRRQIATASYAGTLWSEAQPAATDHPYLTRKGTVAHRLRQRGDVLLVPLYADGYLCNLQRIAADGGKRFLSGGRVKGCYSPIGVLEAGQPLYVCEGWATGATIHAETGTAVACAMNAGNLLEVGRQLQRHHPDSPLIIAGDDDRQTEADGKGNPGRTAATQAAAVLGCGLVLPPFPADAPLELSDFNDLANWRAAP